MPRKGRFTRNAHKKIIGTLQPAYKRFQETLEEELSKTGQQYSDYLDLGSGSEKWVKFLNQLRSEKIPTNSRIMSLDISLRPDAENKPTANRIEASISHLPLKEKGDFFVTCHGALHEVLESTGVTLEEALENITSLIQNKGTLVLGDYYYPQDMGEEQIRQSRRILEQEFGHASGKEGFCDPWEIIRILEKKGFTVEIEQGPASDKTGVGLHHYALVIKKRAPEA